MSNIKRSGLAALGAAAMLLVSSCGSDDATTATTGESAAEGSEVEATTGSNGTADATASSGTETAGSDSGATAGGDNLLDIDAIVNADLNNCAEAPTGDPIKIGMAMDFGEVTAFVDVPGSALVSYVGELVNCAGGVNGHPVEVKVQEVGSDAALAAQELLDWGAMSIIGPPFADFALPIVQAAQGTVPMFASASTEPTLADASVNSYLVTFDDVQMGHAAAQWAFDQGISRAIIFTEGTGIPYSGVNPDAFIERFTELGGEIVTEQTYKWSSDTDFSAQANEIKGLSENNEVVFGAMLANQMTALRGQLEGQGLDGLTYIGTDALDATGIEAETNNEGIAYAAHTAPEPGDQISTLLDKYAADKGEELESRGFMGLYVDSMLIPLEASLQCNCTDPAEVGAQVQQMSDFVGVSGVITYAGTNGGPTKAVPIKRITDGTGVLVDTIDG